nr:HlyD family secretion protein [uncultured Chitinophaga sp.]
MPDINDITVIPEEQHNGHRQSPNGYHSADNALLEVRSEEVEEIMGEMPSWLTRYGVALIGILFIGIAVGAYFLKYPDVIPSQVVVSSINPPVRMVARTSAPIQRIFVKNNEEVPANKPICVLDNAAVYEHVEQIAAITAAIDTSLLMEKFIREVSLPSGLQLGDMQPAYTELYQALENYRFFLSHNIYRNKIQHLRQQSTYYAELNKELKKRDLLLNEQLKIQHNRFLIDSMLKTEKVISKTEFQDAQKRLIEQQVNTESNRSSIIQNTLQQAEYDKNISETELQVLAEDRELKQRIRDVARRFHGEYAVWLRTYVMKSPFAGKVTFFKYWKENQFVASGENVLTITPPVQQYVARGIIPIGGAGKIKPGQRVLIKLSSYPFEEYGMLKGVITGRSDVSMDSAYTVDIRLENGLTTNAQKNIPPQPQLEATGEILTENRSILKRLFENLIGRWRQ